MKTKQMQVVKEYFQSLSINFKPKSAQAVTKVTEKINEKIDQEIKISLLKMPMKLGQKHLEFPERVVEKEEEKEEDLLKKVQTEKKTALLKVKDLERQEYDLKHKIVSHNWTKKSYFASELTQEDKNKLRDLVHSSRKFELSLKKKNSQMKEVLRERSMEEQKSVQKQYQEKRRQKRSMVLESLKYLQLKSAERQKNHKQSEQLVKEIEKRQYLHEMMKEKEEEVRYKLDEQYQEKINEIKERMKFDFKQIQEHERKYEQKLHRYQLKMDSRITQVHHRSRSYGENHFRSLILSRMEQEKVEEFHRLNRGHDMKEKICKYIEEINQKHKPKVSKNSRFIPPKNKSASTHVLSSIDQRNQGLEYLEKAKKMKDIEKEKQRRRTLAVPKTKPQSQYVDYSKSLKVKPYDTAETQFISLIKNGNSLGDVQEAKKALLLADKLETQSKKSKDQILVSSVQNKMKILEALEQ